MRTKSKKIKVDNKPAPSSWSLTNAKIKAEQISEDEFRSETRNHQQEFKALLQRAMQGDFLRVTCEHYREARVLTQRLTACRTYYGLDCQIKHAGLVIYLSPRVAQMEIEMVKHPTLLSATDLSKPRKPQS